jgi:spermidine synthase
VETKLMAHIPILLTETPKNVLIICFGMGSTLRSAVIYDNIHVDVVELVPAAYDAFVFFHADGPDILNQSNVNHYVDDGRNFLLMKQKTYDVITIDPSPPIHSAGTVNLYTKEFIELCKNNLSDTGTLCLWIPPSASTEVKMVMSTFKHVFLHATCWKGFGYPGFFLIGQKKKLTIPYDRFEEAFKNPKIMNDINELGDAINESDMLTNLFLLDEKDFHDYIQDEKIITDDHPYTEFPLWRIIFNPKTHRFLTANHIVEWKSQK